VDVVADSETVAGLWAAGGRVEDALEVVFGNLDVRELVVVIGVEVEVRNNISERLEHGLASCVAGRVGWAHVCGVLSKDVAEGHLVLDHLVVSLGVGDDAQVLVRPGVAGYLMAFGDHTTDDVRPLSGGIDCTLADVDSCHEKGGLETVCGELIKYAISVDVWSVIVCDGDSAGSLASVNSLSSICYISLLWARVVAGASAGGSLIGVTGWTEVDETIRSSAMVAGGAAVSLPSCQQC
jgi:hypothetical protein